MASGTLSSAGIARHTIWAARLVVLAVFLDLFVQFPTIAPFAEGLGASAALVGIIVAAYSVTNLFGNLGAGFVLDRWGRRLPIVVGLAITIVAVFSYSLVQTSEQLIAVRAMHGIGAAVLAPGAFSMIGDRAPSDRWGRAMGLTGALIAVAALVGPPAAGILRDTWGADAVFFVDSAVLLMTLITFLFIARDDVSAAQEGTSAPLIASHEITVRKPALWSAYGATFAITVGIGALVAYLPLVLEEPGRDRRADWLQLRHLRVRGHARDGKPTQPRQRSIRALRSVDRRTRRSCRRTGHAWCVHGLRRNFIRHGRLRPRVRHCLSSGCGPGHRRRRRGQARNGLWDLLRRVLLGVVVGASGSGILADLDDGFVGLPFLAAAAVVLVAVPLVEFMRRAAVNFRPLPEA